MNQNSGKKDSAASGNITHTIRQNMAKYDHRQNPPLLRAQDFYPPSDHRSRRTPTWCRSDSPYDIYLEEIRIYEEK